MFKFKIINKLISFMKDPISKIVQVHEKINENSGNFENKDQQPATKCSCKCNEICDISKDLK